MRRKDFLKSLIIFPLLGTKRAEASAHPLPQDIMSFGAKGDGKTDDTEAFKKALSSLGAIQLVPNKTFVIGDLLLEGQTITGPGELKKRPGSNSCLILKGNGPRVENIRFSSQGTGRRPEAEILLDKDLGWARVINCHFNGTAFNAIGSGQNEATDAPYKDLSVRQRLTIQQNNFSGAYAHHLYLHLIEEVDIGHNYFERSTLDSIRLRQRVKRITITNNFFSTIGTGKSQDSKDAIDCHWSGNELIIENNHFNDIATYAMDVKGHSPDGDYGTSRVQILGNQIRQAGFGGILISAGEKTLKGWKAVRHMVVANNVIEKCGFKTTNPNDAAIFLRHGQENIQLHSNQIIKNYNKGIMVGNFAPGAPISLNISIQGNIVLNNGREGQEESYGIHVAGGENVLICQNIIENNRNDDNPYQTIGLVAESYRNYKLLNFVHANNIVKGHLKREEKI